MLAALRTLPLESEQAFFADPHNVAAAELLETMAGYRNRMVHFYHEIAAQELYQICAHRLEDIADLTQEIKRWVREHPELMDDAL